MSKKKRKYRCALCQNYFKKSELSAEHYPAKSVGNNDIIALDFTKMIDTIQSPIIHNVINKQVIKGEKYENVIGEIFDSYLATDLYPEGRTAYSLCRACNTFLGKYDESYQKFFNVFGNPEKVKGFQRKTKLQIIKAVFGKFLSLPEAKKENFDFRDFVKNVENEQYKGVWNLYLVKRNYTTDLMGFGDISTGKLSFDEGVVYELSDEKFIYNLMNFPKHNCFKMTNIFDILNKNYELVEGVEENGGYHGQLQIGKLFTHQKLDENTLLKK
ncbi:hypothetical protein [Streptococcus intermedius]